MRCISFAGCVKIWFSAHRPKVIDGLLLSLMLISALLYVYYFDLFSSIELQRVTDRSITRDEYLAVSALLCGALMIYSYRRLLEARLESRRRIIAELEARTLAFNDLLTGLPNRRHFEQALNAATEVAPAADASHTLLLIDLNGFKRVNDVFGHAVGDEVLIHVGARLKQAMRDGDLIARLGGDEFAVLALQTPGAEAAMSVALRVMQSLEHPIAAGGTNHRIGAAIGISLMPDDSGEPQELLRKADIALYRAKAEKIRTLSAAHFFTSEMDAHIRERDTLERELRLAIERREVRPHYQPLVELDGGRVIGFEILARWNSITLGAVPPDRFIPIAEETGLIGPLSESLLQQACLDAVGWPCSVQLGFKMSAVLLQSDTFAENVLAILARSDFEPSRIELEITEAALVRDMDGARRALGALRGVGIQIALDDFGTGYSALYHMRALKPDKVKIHRSFVDAMQHDPHSASIVKALIGLGIGLGAKVTAEGVETKEQELSLREQGCDHGQGYRFGAAVDAAAASDLALSTNRFASLQHFTSRSMQAQPETGSRDH